MGLFDDDFEPQIDQSGGVRSFGFKASLPMSSDTPQRATHRTLATQANIADRRLCRRTQRTPANSPTFGIS
jgi:hypothetical protein